MGELKNITIEDTGLFLIDKKNSIYKAILKNNITNLYELFINFDNVLSLLNGTKNDKGEFIAIIKLLKCKYLNGELDFDLDVNFKKCRRARSWNELEKKLQSYGIPMQVSYMYSSIIYAHNLYEKYRVIDIIYSIYEKNILWFSSDKYNEKIYNVAKNRVSIILDYYKEYKEAFEERKM